MEQTRSRWWYLLPIFLEAIGGVIAYFVLRGDDPAKARNCLLLGVILFVLHVMLAVSLGFVTGPFEDDYYPAFFVYSTLHGG